MTKALFLGTKTGRQTDAVAGTFFLDAFNLKPTDLDTENVKEGCLEFMIITLI